jgi:hypothetical protein
VQIHSEEKDAENYDYIKNIKGFLNVYILLGDLIYIIQNAKIKWIFILYVLQIIQKKKQLQRFFVKLLCIEVNSDIQEE